MTLTQARTAWARRQRQYVVGYIASGNMLHCHYRSDDHGLFAPRPMTLREAKARLAEMPSTGCAIFKLVPIEIGGGSR